MYNLCSAGLEKKLCTEWGREACKKDDKANQGKMS